MECLSNWPGDHRDLHSQHGWGVIHLFLFYFLDIHLSAIINANTNSFENA